MLALEAAALLRRRPILPGLSLLVRLLGYPVLDADISHEGRLHQVDLVTLGLVRPAVVASLPLSGSGFLRRLGLDLGSFVR